MNNRSGPASSYSESNPYRRNVNGVNSGLSTPLFTSDRQTYHYEPDSYHPEIYSPPCFTNPGLIPPVYNLRVSAGSHQLIGNTRPSTLSENPYSSFYNDSPVLSNISNQTSHSLSDDQSPDNEIDYYENNVRLKLQELEQLLLDDSDDDNDDNMVVDHEDEEWANRLRDILDRHLQPPTSPKESSSDSNLSGVDCSRENRTPKQLLFDCAAAISKGNMEEASGIIAELRQLVSIQGEPLQRLAAYLVEGLAARMASSGQGLYKALKCKEPPTSDRLSAMQILFEVCPCFKFGFMAANCAIIEAIKDEERVHIIDFDINQGSQYIDLIQTLSKGSNKPKLRITGVDDPESVQRSVGGLKVIGQRLEQLARQEGVPFEFQATAAKTGDVTSSMLDCRVGEALVVNFAFQLHHMPDESVSTVNQRDCLLRMVKGLEPKLVTVVEQDVNTNTAPFFPRFVEVYNYYSAVFESLDATMPRESPDRMNVEKQCLARDIVNIVACEGVDRIERYEAAGKWRARMNMAGFVSCPLSSYVNGTIRSLLKMYCDRFILDKKIGIGQPNRIENAKILVANTAMDTDKVKIYGARVRVDSMAKVAQIEGAEKEKMREKVQKIIGHGINCFVNRQLIYNFPEELFADAGILAIEHADFDGIERLALVTGGEIASTFDNPETVKLGHCKLIEEIMIGEDKLIHFSGVAMGQACTIVLRGASQHVLDEAERSLHDALCVLSQTVNDTRVLLGGGWPEMVMSKDVDELARKTPGKKSHAIEAFSRALQAIPTIIADNAGLDSAELISQLRAEHHTEGTNAGIDVISGSVGDMEKLGISEAFKVKQAVLLSATEAAEMILRVDEIITCAPRKREDRM